MYLRLAFIHGGILHYIPNENCYRKEFNVTSSIPELLIGGASDLLPLLHDIPLGNAHFYLHVLKLAAKVLVVPTVPAKFCLHLCRTKCEGKSLDCSTMA